MFSKLAFVFAFLAVAQVAVATPPACLLAAINEQENPGDLETICVDNQRDVQDLLADICGDDTQLAWDSFAKSCKAKGFNVRKPTSSDNGDDDNNDDSNDDDNDDSSSDSSSPTGTSSSNTPDDPVNTAITSNSTGTDSAPATTSTGAAARPEMTFGAAAVAGVAVGFFGLL